MTARTLRPFALLILALAVVACDKGRQSPAKTPVRVINVAPTFESLDFRRENTQSEALAFKDTFDPSPYDEDTYDFNVDGRVGNQTLRILTFEQKVVTGTTYAFVLYTLTASAGGVSHATLEYPTLPSSATDSQIIAFHAGEDLPPVDVHIAPPGTNVNGAVPWGTLSFQQTIAPRRLAAGSYEITLTAAGDPSNVLLTSLPFELGAARSTVLVITPEGGQTNELMSVFVLQDTSGSLLDRDATASLRVINAATDRAPRDVAVGGVFSPPLISSAPFAEATEYAGPVPVASSVALHATPPGNPGVLELNVAISTAPAVQYTTFITGDAGVLKQLLTPDDNRRLPTVSKLRFYDAAQQFPDGVYIYLNPPGTDIASVLPIATISPGLVSATFPFTAGDYEIVLQKIGTDTPIVAGPIPVSLLSGGIYTALMIDGAVSGTVELVLLDDFP